MDPSLAMKMAIMEMWHHYFGKCHKYREINNIREIVTYSQFI